jgi:hypothetical protein
VFIFHTHTNSYLPAIVLVAEIVVEQAKGVKKKLERHHFLNEITVLCKRKRDFCCHQYGSVRAVGRVKFLYETEYTVSSLWVAAQQKAATLLTWQWTK